jgi:antitoxin component YwqK of YwqJK toxin-antitoxin module
MTKEEPLYKFEDENFCICDKELAIDFCEAIPKELPTICELFPGVTGYLTLSRPDGTLVQRCAYVRGELHGPSYTYYRNGQVASERWFVQGKYHGRALDFSESGKLLCRKGFVQGRLQGSYKKWYETGTIQCSGGFLHGFPHGQFTLYHDDGLSLRSTDFSHGRRHGIDYGWTEDGFLIFCEKWREGEKVKDISVDFFQQCFTRR